MDWNQVLASYSYKIESTGDSESEQYWDHGFDVQMNHECFDDHDRQEDDDAQSCSCDSWDNDHSNMEMEDDESVVDDEGELGDQGSIDEEYYCNRSSSSCLRKDRGKDEDGGTVDDISDLPGLTKMNREMEDKLFWERCLDSGY